MSYLARLKQKISGKVPEYEATKGTEGAFDTFVASKSAPLRQISAANDPLPDPAAESRRQRVMAMLSNDPALRLAVVCDGQGDPVPVTVAIREGTCEVLIPAARFDPLAILDLVERHTRTNVTRISPPEQIKGLEMMI